MKGNDTHIWIARLLLPALLVGPLTAGAMSAGAQTPKRPDTRPTAPASPGVSAAVPDDSHSAHGAAFDQGPRQRAILLTGVGSVHFPVTTANPLAQRFFDQGTALLYSFAYYEAERSFRQVALLDPDCAMAYWALAQTDNSRAKEFLKLAQERETHVTDRERRYIDAALRYNRDGTDAKAREADYIHDLEQIVFAYPDDLDAKVMLAWAMPRTGDNGASTRMGIDALLKQVLARDPMHPGALHYRIHLWDGENAAYALDSARAYPKAVPNIGHAQHMPGHLYAQLGLWDQAVAAMEAAARVERRYFYDSEEMPFHSWNYSHDLHYLVANLGYLGRIEEGVRLAQELLDSPRDPQANSGGDWDIWGQGRFAMMRMRLRGERWDDILTDPDPGWQDTPEDKSWKAYTLGMAALGEGDRQAAHKQLTALEQIKASGDEMECARRELRGRLAVAEGDTAHGLEDLRRAAEIEKTKFAYSDPSRYPRPLYESLAWGYLQAAQWTQAETVLKAGLAREPNNGFALCLLAEAFSREGNQAEAATTAEQLQRLWKNADPDLPALRRMQAVLKRAGIVCSVGGRRSEVVRPSPASARLGPSSWQPFPAPEVGFTDPHGKPVRLSDFRGHNLLLVFTLGGSCPACMEQLAELGREKTAFAALDTRLVAVSADSPEAVRNFPAGMASTSFTLLCDPSRRAARALKAVDEFENRSLHAALLIDAEGRVWWRRSGSEPFTDSAFLKTEIARLNAWRKRERR